MRKVKVAPPKVVKAPKKVMKQARKLRSLSPAAQENSVSRTVSKLERILLFDMKKMTQLPLRNPLILNQF